MKYKKKLQRLAEKQKWWDGLSQEDKRAIKRHGSIKTK